MRAKKKVLPVNRSICQRETHQSELRLVSSHDSRTPISILPQVIKFLHLDQSNFESNANRTNKSSKKFSFCEFLRAISVTKSSKSFKIVNLESNQHAILYMKNGDLIDVEFNGDRGVDAVLKIIKWNNIEVLIWKSILNLGIRSRVIFDDIDSLIEKSNRITFKNQKSSVNRRSHILITQPYGFEDLINTSQIRRVNMEKVRKILETFKDINGFIAVGVFSPEGEVFEEISLAGYDIASMGAIANELLVKAQASTEMMNLGRGNLIHINAPKAHIFVTCLNESSEFNHTEFGKAHIHMALVISEKGNQPMAKMKLNKAVGAIAPQFR